MQRVIVFLLAFALAGCVSGGDSDESSSSNSKGPSAPSDWATRAIFGTDNPADTDHIATHDHSDRSLHAGLTTPNFEIQGFDPLETDLHGMSAGGYYCGEVSKEGERKLAVVNSFTSAVALVVVDVTDPASPVMLGELSLPRTQIYDSAITDDGQFAILATSPLAAIIHEDGSGVDSYQESPIWKSCGTTTAGPETELPFVSGTLLIDLRTPSSPEIADFVPGPAIGPHSVSSTTIDGVRYATSSITNLVYAVSYFNVFTVEDILGVGKLVPYSGYTANYITSDVVSGLALLNGHVDATLAKHPDGRLIGYLANWDGGLLIVDFSLPVPLLLAEFGNNEQSMGASSGSIHTAYVVGEVNDRYLIVTGQEVGSSFNQEGNRRPTGQMVVLDATDPSNPTPVARWTMPVFVNWAGNLHFSTHYPTVVGDTLFVATYHGGVWAADMSEESWPELPSLGVFLPDRASEKGIATDLAYAPYVLDVLTLENDNLLVFDGSGAYSLKFHAESNVPVQAPWTEDAWI